MTFIETIFGHLESQPGKAWISEVHGDHLHSADGAWLLERVARLRGTLEARNVIGGKSKSEALR